MKANARALRRLDPAVRLVLLYGADAAASVDHARNLKAQFPDADGGTVIHAANLTADPAALVAAATEIAMFGGPHLVRVDDAGDEVLPAVERVLAAPAIVNPVVIVAGGLKKTSKLLQRAEADPAAVAVASHFPDAAAAAAMIAELGSEVGLRLRREAVEAVGTATGGDRGLIRQELTKLALYLDATPATPVVAERADVAAIGADFGDADLDALVSGVAGGDPVAVAHQLAEFDSAAAGIMQLRAVMRRFWLLLDLRLAVDGGASAARAVEGARPPVFWRDRGAVAAQVARWRTPALRAALARLLAAERAAKRSGGGGEVAVDQLLLALAVQAGR